MRKVGVLLTVLLLLFAAGCTVNGYKYEKMTYCYKISKYVGKDTVCTVPETRKDMEVAIIGMEAFSGNKYVETVIVPETVTELRDRAFADCPNLTRVELPAGLTRIGDDVFSGSDVTLVVVEDSLGMTYAIEQGIPYELKE